MELSVQLVERKSHGAVSDVITMLNGTFVSPQISVDGV
jgi:hypothetical protein